MRSSLTLLAALGAALALAGPGGGHGPPSGGNRLDPNVALRISAPVPRAAILAPFSFVVISLERSCPPPAILACRPATRLVGRLRGAPDGAELIGRVRSRAETVARWRLMDGILEVVTGALALYGPEPIEASTPGIEANQATLVELFAN